MRVLCPRHLDEALDRLATDGDALIPMAGCTDLLVFWPTRLEAHDRTYLDLSGIDGLTTIRWSDEWLELGAMTTYWDAIRDTHIANEFPILIQSARQVGAVQIQSRGTWAGNIANASPAADGVPALMACDATVVLTSTTQSQEVPLDQFYLDYRKTVRRLDQLITAIRIPRRKRSHQSFHKVGPRRAQAITKIGLAMTNSDDGWRIVANSVAPIVKRCVHLENAINQQVTIRSPDDFLPMIAQDVSPIDDIRSTSEYRRRVMSRVLFHALQETCPWIGAA